MEGRPGQQRKTKKADELIAFLLAYSGGRRRWQTATDNDVFYWACFLDSQGKATTWVHDASCPGVGSTRGESCAPTSRCAEQYEARSIDEGFISMLRMGMK